MNAQCCVFVGPSLDRAAAHQRFSGALHPPVSRGDLDRLTFSKEPPYAVGIIDGTFYQRLPVTPKEVLRALEAGIRLYGSSSMGALRAVECAPFGMIGIGAIYDWFAGGTLDADDEVAITFDPNTLSATSEPLVNIRAAMAAAVTTSAVSASTADLVIAKAKQLYFPDRTYRNIGRRLQGLVSEEEYSRYRDYVSGPTCPDQKRIDALALLDAVSADCAATGKASGEQ